MKKVTCDSCSLVLRASYSACEQIVKGNCPACYNLFGGYLISDEFEAEKLLRESV